MVNKTDDILDLVRTLTSGYPLKRNGNTLTARNEDDDIILDTMIFKDGIVLFWLDQKDRGVLMVTIDYTKFSVEYTASFINYVIKDIMEGSSEVINKFFKTK